MSKHLFLRLALLAGAWLATASAVAAPPHILVIMTDDVGLMNVSAYSRGIMSRTPNIDRIADQGVLFTDHYAEPTCTPGRAAFITGQLPLRTGLTTVGLPGSPVGLDKRDPTLAEVLKQAGYLTAQYGKNHLGDRNEHLPTVHGFDEFYGNLYHLNSEEEPFQLDWPKDPAFNARYRPRGVLDCRASEVDDPTVDPRFGRVGKQVCRDTGALDPKRMETVDDEFEARTIGFMERAVKAGKPFFVWHNTTRMHLYTHVPRSYIERIAGITAEDDVYGAGMLQLDDSVGRILDSLDRMGIAKDTIVVFTADNGPMAYEFPDGGTTAFRSEKATTWEGGVRVPMLVRWPARIPARSISNGIQAHLDMFVTLASAAGVKDVGAKLLESHKVKIDGVDNLAHWTSGAPSARDRYYYYNEGDLTALRVGNWKFHFKSREGFFDWNKPSGEMYNLRMDPFEKHGGITNNKIAMRKAWLGGVARDALGEHLMSLEAFPPRQKGGTLKPGQ